MSARTIAGCGSLQQLGEAAHELGLRHALIVADQGVPAVDRAVESLSAAGVSSTLFRDFEANPSTADAARGAQFAAAAHVDSIIGLGGGSSLDCAKAINFLVTNGGHMRDYRGYAKAWKPMLPSIGIPTTAGTGSEAQSFAVISDAETHIKMACGDPKAAFALVILDPELVATAPRSVRAAAGFDALAHCVETLVTTRRSSLSLTFTRAAWNCLAERYVPSLDSQDLELLGAMQTGAYLAGLAIENSMLGAAHACANPLTRRYDTVHGHALAILLPHVVAWNGCVEYKDWAPDLALHLREMASAAGLPTGLRSAGVPQSDLPMLAAEAAEQWTGRFNPRLFDAAGALEIYRCAY